MKVSINAQPRRSPVLACLVAFAALNACSGHATSDHSALTDTEWRLSRVEGASQTQVLTDDHPVFSLQIHSDGSANGQVACNRWTGTHQLGDTTVTISNIGSTRARCHYRDDAMAALGSRYLSTLETASPYRVTDDELVLDISEDQSWVFRPL